MAKGNGNNVEKRKGEAISSGTDISWKKIKILENGGGEEYQVVGNILHL